MITDFIKNYREDSLVYYHKDFRIIIPMVITLIIIMNWKTILFYLKLIKNIFIKNISKTSIANYLVFAIFYNDTKKLLNINLANTEPLKINTLYKINMFDTINLIKSLKKCKNIFKNRITSFIIVEIYFLYAYSVDIYTINNPLAKKLKLIDVIYNLIRIIQFIIIAVCAAVLYLMLSFYYLNVSFGKQYIIWYIVIILFFWLISGFNNFLNKYRFGKYTTSINRFWKRIGITFWLIECFLFLIFFYYFINSSQEPLYTYDYSSLNNECLPIINSLFKNLLTQSVIIYTCFILIIYINSLRFKQQIAIISFITAAITYILYVESYQFFYILSIFNEKSWIFIEDIQIWTLDTEKNNLRVKQQYLIICLIAKYWHFIFIFISWFLFILKSYELKKINYNLLGYNVQNLIILYILNIGFSIQWVKIFWKKFFEKTYFWLQNDYDINFLYIFIREMYTIIKCGIILIFIWYINFC